MTQERSEQQLLLEAMHGLADELTQFTAQLEIIAQIRESTCDTCGEGFAFCEVGHATSHDGKWYHSSCYGSLPEKE